jgi:glutathione S-transferase
MILYIANRNYSSWSLRPWLLLRMLGVDFEERLVPFEGGGPQAAFREFSPSGTVPCLVVDGITVWDSLAIVETLAESWPATWPDDRAARAWSRSASAEMHAGFPELRSRCSMSCGQRVRLHEFPAGLERDWVRIDALWNDGLRRFGGPFLAGSAFTAVDAFFAPVAFRFQSYSPTLSRSAAAYARRLLDLPPMGEWYAKALAEPFRDDDHEKSILAMGEVLEDFRAPPG